MDERLLGLIAINLLVLVASFTVHEYGHALMANLLGDDTGQRLGRLTLDPTAHLDPIGSVAIPLLQMVSVASFGQPLPLLGWARPVPFQGNRLTRKVSLRGGSALIALAGPIMNVLLALLAGLALWILTAAAPGFLQAGQGAVVASVLRTLLVLNLGLACFNLIPVPPLDGGWILSYVLPGRLSRVVDLLGRFSILMLIVAMVLPGYLGVSRFLAAAVLGSVATLAALVSRLPGARGAYAAFEAAAPLAVIMLSFELAIRLMTAMITAFGGFA